jgi:hypothetical protein
MPCQQIEILSLFDVVCKYGTAKYSVSDDFDLARNTDENYVVCKYGTAKYSVSDDFDLARNTDENYVVCKYGTAKYSVSDDFDLARNTDYLPDENYAASHGEAW